MTRRNPIFVPTGRVLYSKAVYLVAEKHVEVANRTRAAGAQLQLELKDLRQVQDGLGCHLAAGHIKSWGIVTRGMLRIDGRSIEPGDEVELPLSVWKLQSTKLHLTSAMRIEGWNDDEIPYDGGRLLVLVDEASLTRFLAEVDLCSQAGMPAVEATLSVRADELAGWMLDFAKKNKTNASVVKRDAALTAIRKATGCTAREAKAAFESLPFPDLRYPPPKSRKPHSDTLSHNKSFNNAHDH